MDDIVGKEQNLEKCYIGHPILGRNLSQGILVEEFPNILLDGGSLGVEPPDPPWMSLQIGDQHMISIFPIFEEGQLLGFDGIFGDRTSHYDESMGLFPTVRLILKRSHFPSIAKFFEPTRSGSNFDSSIFLGNDRIATAFLVEPFDPLLVEES